MHAKKIVLLVAVVGVLAFLALRQLPDDGGPAQDLGVEGLLVDLDRSAVDFVRFENTASQRLLEFERDEVGAWRLVHPIDARANDDALATLLARVVTTAGTPATDATRASAGLDPPRTVLELVEFHGLDGERRHVIEFGGLDLDERNVHVYADGRILRAGRGLLDDLERPTMSFRQQQLLLGLESRDVVAIERSGLLRIGAPEDRLVEVPPKVYTSNPGGGLLAQDLVAEFVDDEWLASEPYKVRLDPAAMPLFLDVLTRTNAENYFDGLDADPVGNGFDDPLLTFELTARDGSRRTLEFGSPVRDLGDLPMRNWTWIARVDGDDSVHYLVDGSRARALTQPVENLVQFQLLRVLRSDMTRVVARGPEGELRVERSAGQWFVTTDSGRRRADDGLVSAWLGDLDRLEYVNLLAPATEDFGLEGSLEVATEYGEHVLELGPLITVAGVEARAVRRQGERLWGFVPRDLVAMSRAAPTSLLDLRLVGLRELRTSSVRVERAADGAEARWVRDTSTGLWAPAGAAGLEDRAFALLVDRVLSPVAARWLDAIPEAAREATAGLVVTVEALDGSLTRYRVVEVGDSIVAVWDGLAAELATRNLFDGLTERLDAAR